MYGHNRTKTQMKGLPGPYWVENMVDIVSTEMRRLNTTTLDVTTRLQQLRTDKIGGFLVVTKVTNAIEPGIPFLTVLAAPSVTTFNITTGDVGVILEDVCDIAVLHKFSPDLNRADVHCPVVGAQEGFS